MRLIYLFVTIGMMIITISQLSSCHSNLSIETAQYAVNGQKLYQTHCKNCHGEKGEGLGKLYPPLTDNDFFAKNKNTLSCIIKNGLHKEIVIHGVTYSDAMPANPNLTDTDIAYILTYITTRFADSDSTFTLKTVKQSLKDCK